MISHWASTPFARNCCASCNTRPGLLRRDGGERVRCRLAFTPELKSVKCNYRPLFAVGPKRSASSNRRRCESGMDAYSAGLSHWARASATRRHSASIRASRWRSDSVSTGGQKRSSSLRSRLMIVFIPRPSPGSSPQIGPGLLHSADHDPDDFPTPGGPRKTTLLASWRTLRTTGGCAWYAPREVQETSGVPWATCLLSSPLILI
jgi:hypothetical protein